MKITYGGVRHDEVTEYKVGDIIYDGNEYYLVIKHGEAYALLSLESNAIASQFEKTLERLYRMQGSDLDRLVKAELVVEGEEK